MISPFYFQNPGLVVAALTCSDQAFAPEKTALGKGLQCRPAQFFFPAGSREISAFGSGKNWENPVGFIENMENDLHIVILVRNMPSQLLIKFWGVVPYLRQTHVAGFALNIDFREKVSSDQVF